MLSGANDLKVRLAVSIKLVASTGETHGLTKTPQTFSVGGEGIVRVRLQTDNQHGNTVRATGNSLPVVEFEIER